MGAGEVQIGRRTLPSSAYSRSFTRWAIPEKTLSTTFSKTQMVQFKGWNKAGQVCKVCFSQMNRRMSLPFLALFSPVCTLGPPTTQTNEVEKGEWIGGGKHTLLLAIKGCLDTREKEEDSFALFAPLHATANVRRGHR